MKLRQVLELVEGKVITRRADLDIEVCTGFGADLMSDVLAFAHEDCLLLSGLINPQVVRTAEMAGVKVILFVRGKTPPPETIALAEGGGPPSLLEPFLSDEKKMSLALLVEAANQYQPRSARGSEVV